MNGSLALCDTLLPALVKVATPNVGMIICPPAPYIERVAKLVAGSAIATGLQNVSAQAAGAYTGEYSVAMARDFACRYSIVGHSERRAQQAESDDLVAAKAQACLQGDLIPIICFGETAAERGAGHTEATLARQLAPVLASLQAAQLANIVVAYEPVWAIGNGVAASAAEIVAAHAFIRRQFDAQFAGSGSALTVLYGGSVKASNAGELLSLPGVDGGLIGGASLVADEFAAIYHAAGTAH